ncbi:MAG: preprotein translocase subunit SecA [Minisyncoccia bacterium]
MASFLSKIFPNTVLVGYQKKVALINSLEPELQKMNSEELLLESQKLKEEVQNGKDLNDALPRAFALAREAGKRTLGQRHFDVQLIGGMTLHDGKIAEMLTGEGKTLAATLPAYLNALAGKGAHVVTVNDYLAKRDAVWMGQIYHALGLSVSCLLHDAAYLYDPTFESDSEADRERDAFGNFKVVEKFLRPVSRKDAYAADITYGTNHEFGFDFLRDNLSQRTIDCAQREHNFVIIDEVDSILIDEARTPLIISAPDAQASEFYKTFAKIAEKLVPEEDYMTDEKLKSVNITESGIEKVEKMTGVQNIYSPENIRLVHFLQESLKAKALFKLDKDYIVRNGEIIIVDEFTGRMLMGRRFSGGLHQAIEAKEGVQVKEENRTYAQVTIQNYFRLYKKISGMTGTAQTSAEEFHKVYNLDVISIPPNKKMIREDKPDAIYKNKEAKYRAAVETIKTERVKGRPILVGTTSIVNNEIISEYLRKAGVPHEVLNAKNHEREGAIIAQAGRAGAVTVATNMAGRGVDIILGGNPVNPEEAQKIKGIGGLLVVGTERHEARRIDNQLRGRSGRQGDPGASQFFLSLEDDLMRIFGGDKIKGLMQTLNYPEDIPIESRMVAKVVNQAQAKVEGANFDIRRHLLDFDDVLNKQRTAIYTRRKKFLEAGEKNEVLPILKEILENFAINYKTALENEITTNPEKREEIEKQIEHLDKHLAGIPEALEPERAVIVGQHLVRILDSLWIDHLENLEALRESVNIRAYGQHDPLVEYRREAHMLYQQLNGAFESLTFNTIFALLQIDLNKIQNQIHANQEASQHKPQSQKEIGRNDPCWCGSGKKFKKCHGA